MRKIWLPITALLLFSTTSCKRKPIRQEAKVDVKREKSNDGSNDWIYWYIIFSNNGNGCYYYSCNCPPTGQIPSGNFVYSSTIPVNISKLEEVTEEDIDISDLPSGAQNLLEENEPEVQTTGDGLPVNMNVNEEPESNNNATEEEGSSEGSSDTGSSDSGGSGGDGGGE